MRNTALKIFPALNGDAMILTLNEVTILIDSGYVDTYHNYIKPALLELQRKNLPLSLFITTHIDSDHISGGIAFLTENIKDQVIPIQNIWHNSYRHLTQFEPLQKEEINGNSLDSLSNKSILKESEKEKNISAEQGSSLAILIQKGSYPWNQHFAGKAVCIENGMNIQLTSSILIKVLSPDSWKLSKLYGFWKKELYKRSYKVDNDQKPFDDAFEFIIGSEREIKRVINKEISASTVDLESLAKTVTPEDERISNGSSIAFSIEWENKRTLFLGDAHPSLIVKSLKSTFKGESFPLKFNLIKVSHHGSIQNTSPELLELIDSENFMISTNGKVFNHPDIETIARIVTRKSNFKRTLYFNYPTTVSTVLNEEGLKKKYNYEIVVGDGKESIDFNI